MTGPIGTLEQNLLLIVRAINKCYRTHLIKEHSVTIQPNHSKYGNVTNLTI